jgi:hypothetical protein
MFTGEENRDVLRKLIDQDPPTQSGRVEPSGGSLILADRRAKHGGYAASYSSWRRSQNSDSPSSWRPIGVRSSSP